MTIKEIKELRVQQEEIRQDNCKESQQALKQLDELEQKAHDDLVKKIAKHFKGIKPFIDLHENGIWISVDNNIILGYKTRKFEWNNITSKLAHTIKEEYEEVYGEPKEQQYIGYETSCHPLIRELENARYDTSYLPTPLHLK